MPNVNEHIQDEIGEPENNDGDEDGGVLLGMEAHESIPPRVEVEVSMGDEHLPSRSWLMMFPS